MIKLAIALLIGIALGVIYHASIKPWAIAKWQQFRNWRKNSTRQL